MGNTADEESNGERSVLSQNIYNGSSPRNERSRSVLGLMCGIESKIQLAGGLFEQTRCYHPIIMTSTTTMWDLQPVFKVLMPQPV